MTPPPDMKLRPRPAIFRALGRCEPPAVIEADGERYELADVFKHDSWAATALYNGPGGKIVAKFNRRQPLLFLPMGWLGRWLGRREARAFRLLKGVPGIPPAVGVVHINGRPCPSAFAHWFIEGHPLHRDEKPGNAFFSQLEDMVGEMHRRGLAYVDLNKRENILVTEEGLPVLVDFQIHFAPPGWIAWLPPVRWLLKIFQDGDLYHLRKHILRHCPGLLPPDELTKPYGSQPAAIRLWRLLYVAPVQWFRRRLLVRLRIRTGKGLATSELNPEKAVRLSREKEKR